MPKWKPLRSEMALNGILEMHSWYIEIFKTGFVFLCLISEEEN